MRPLSRERRIVIVLLVALVLSFTVYYREQLHNNAKSTQSVLLDLHSPTPDVPPCKRPAVEEQQDVLMAHTYRDDGILEVNPDGGHPIFELIELANSRWQAKLRKASKNLNEAVEEYVKRYNRRPPKGFDKWWQYVEKHSIQLPDEYDQIFKDLEPFWGYHPHDLQKIQEEQENHTDSYTLGTNETGELDILKVSFGPSTNNWDPEVLLSGGHTILEMLKDIQHDLPPFRAVISPHDSPMLFTTHKLKERAVEAARHKTHVNIKDVVNEDDEDQEAKKESGWFLACPKTSYARQAKKLEPLPYRKTFIVDHSKSMDPCSHPQHVRLIGEFLFHPEPGYSQAMIPRFAYCKTFMHYDIQIPLPPVIADSDDSEWDDKLDEQINWRGSNTGMWHAPDTPWKSAQRARLVDLAHKLNGTAKVLIPPRDGERVRAGLEISLSKLNAAVTDISFSGKPVGCHQQTCEELEQTYEWRRFQNSKESEKFRYIIDVDGNAWSSRFRRLMATNSLIFKATAYPEWFYDRIEPWVHYIPVQVDYSDLYDTLVFFRGGLYGEGAHPDLARKIAVEGRNWTRSFWRKEDIVAYIYRLLLEYARVMNTDREAMTYSG